MLGFGRITFDPYIMMGRASLHPGHADSCLFNRELSSTRQADY